MKRWFLLFGLLIPSVVMAGAPQSVTISRHGRGVWECVMNRSTAFASAAIDTVFVDTKDVWQGILGNAATGGTELAMFFDNLATADSLTCVMIPAVIANDTEALLVNTSGIASFQVTGGAASTVTFEKTVSAPAARFWRFIITNNQHASQAAIDYKLYIQAQAAP